MLLEDTNTALSIFPAFAHRCKHSNSSRSCLKDVLGNILRNHKSLVVQVFGLFAVTATATGSLYFLDTKTVASGSGLNAVGVLLLILNLTFLLVAGACIASAGSDTVRVFLKKHHHKYVGRAQSILGGHTWLKKLFRLRSKGGNHGPLQQLSVQNHSATPSLEE